MRSYIQSEKAMKRAKKFQVQLQNSESKQNKGYTLAIHKLIIFCRKETIKIVLGEAKH